MKNSTFINMLSRALQMLLVALCAPATAWADESSLLKFTFAGTGDSDIVESVTVTNLSRPDLVPVTLNGTDILYLGDEETITPIENVEEAIGITQPILTPNPSFGDGTLIFDVQEEGPVHVNIYSQSGMLMESAVLDARKGRNTARIPGQMTGFYIVNVEGAGIKSSTRWICSGSKSFSGIALGGAAQWADRPLPVKANSESSTPARVAQVSEGYLVYTPGDILRIEGKSGEMRTIMHVSPQKEGIITIDFFRCKDATGYNYPIMRSGDMLWMLEDLRPQAVQGVTRTYVPATWKSIADHAPAMFTSQGRAYYNIHAARMVMPEGWRAPTIDEMKDFLKALNSDVSTLGDFVKDRDYSWIGTLVEGPDSIHMQLQPLGYINEEGRLTGANATGAWLMRNTINHGNPVTFEVRATESEFFPQVEHNKGCGFLLRGCRPASSAYAKIIESQFSSASQPMPMVSGPIGEYYTFGPDRYSVFFDYSAWTNNEDDKPQCQQRSGILYKNHNSAAWQSTGKQLVPLDVNGADYRNHLRKVAAQGNSEGYEGVVYATWSQPFRVHYGSTVGGSTGVVNVTIFGDAAHNNSIVDGYASRPLLDKDGNPYMWQMPECGLPSSNPNIVDGQFGGYLSDMLYQYYTRAFNLNCIQDMTDDGVEEIVMNVGKKIAIFDGVTLRCLRERSFSDHLRFDVADVTGDGYEDIVIICDEYYLIYNKYIGFTNCYIFDKGHIDENHVLEHTISQSNRYCDVKVGRMSGDKMPEIAILTRGGNVSNNTFTSIDNFGYLNMYRLYYDDNHNLQLKTIIEGTKVNCFPNWNHLSSNLSGNLNLVFGYFRGHSYNQDLIVGDGLWRWDDADGGKPVYQFQMLPETKMFNLTSYHANAFTISSDAIAAVQLRKDVGESLLYFVDRYILTDGIYVRSNTKLVEKWLDADGKTVKSNEKLCSDKFGWGNDQIVRALNTNSKTEFLAHPVLCKFADREMTKHFRFIKHEPGLSEPRISAVIAAAPYYEDIGADNAETSWGHNRSSGISEAKSDTWGGSVIVGYEYEFSMPFFSSVNAGVEFTAKVSGAYTSATGEETVISHGYSFQAQEDHMILMEATPYDCYTYEITNSGNPDDIGMTFVLSMPRKRTIVPISFSDYELLMGNQRNAAHPNRVITAKAGDPWSYPSNFKDDRYIIRHNNDYPFLMGMVNGTATSQSAGSGSGYATRSISLEKNHSETSSVEIGMETELVGKVNGVKAGVGFNYSHNKENTRTIGSELTVEGTVPALPSIFDPNHKNFFWNLVWYYVRDGKEIYPVVNYIVTPKAITEIEDYQYE